MTTTLTTTTRPAYRELASIVDARLNCISSGNVEWEAKHEARLLEIVSRYFPRGSGFDNGTKIDLDRSTGERLVFTTAFHHMNENGYYDGWTEHTVTVTASLQFGFSASISGRNRNDIKEYIGEMFEIALSENVDID